MSLLAWLNDQIAKVEVKDLIEVKKPNEQEKVLGTVEDEDTKKLYSLFLDLVEQLKLLEKKLDKVHKSADGECGPVHEEIRTVERKLKLVKDLFWGSVHDLIEVPNDVDGLIVCENWQIATLNSERKGSIGGITIVSSIGGLGLPFGFEGLMEELEKRFH